MAVARVILLTEHPEGNQLLAGNEEHGAKSPQSLLCDPKPVDLTLSKVKCG